MEQEISTSSLMNIPKSFTINGQSVTIDIVDRLDGMYGHYSDAEEKITIARTIESDGRVIKLSPLQLENTFWHEVFHVFQFHGKGRYDEAESATYAGMLTELIRSSGLRINPNEIVVNKPEVYEE